MSQEKGVWIAVGIAVAAASLAMLAVGGMMGPGMMGRWYEHALPPVAGGWSWPMMGIGWLMMLAFWAVLGAGLFFLTRAATERRERRSEGPDALEILRRRYAAGEIDDATYERQREKLAA